MKRRHQSEDAKRHVCPMCESRLVVSREENQPFIYGDGIELSAVVVVHACEDCGFVFTDDTAEDARQEAVCRHIGILTPWEIAKIREQYGMSRPQFARAFGFGEASLDRWENGINTQSIALDNLLYLLANTEIANMLLQRDRHIPMPLYSETSKEKLTVEAKVVHFEKFRFLSETKKVREDAKIFQLRRSRPAEGARLCI